jgi:hypothetical protein
MLVNQLINYFPIRLLWGLSRPHVSRYGVKRYFCVAPLEEKRIWITPVTSRAPTAAKSASEKDETRHMPRIFANPGEIASAGQKIYDEKYRAEFEAKHPGQYVAIDVNSKKAFVAETPSAAVKAAQKESPQALVHLIRIGSSGAFKVSYRANGARDWVFG